MGHFGGNAVSATRVRRRCFGDALLAMGVSGINQLKHDT